MSIVEELRTKQSRDNRDLLDRAADRIEELERELLLIKDTKSNNSEDKSNKQIEEMAKHCTYHHNGECCEDMTHINDCDLMCVMFGTFANLEMAGYRKERQGEWKVRGLSQYERRSCYINHAITCSNCGFDIEMLQGKRYNYCPNCGSKMKGE